MQIQLQMQMQMEKRELERESQMKETWTRQAAPRSTPVGLGHYGDM